VQPAQEVRTGLRDLQACRRLGRLGAAARRPALGALLGAGAEHLADLLLRAAAQPVARRR